MIKLNDTNYLNFLVKFAAAIITVIICAIISMNFGNIVLSIVSVITVSIALKTGYNWVDYTSQNYNNNEFYN